MIRVAFTFISGKNWTGGYNYLLNLLRALAENASHRVSPVLFVGNDVSEKDLAPFEQISGIQLVRNVVFNEAGKGRRLRQALLMGSDHLAARVFSERDIDVVFESAQFYGWRFPLLTVAWLPDFQHRHLKHLFDFKAYWKRDIGFRAQVLSGRRVMLSSEDARQDCERFYPSAKGRTHVVRFAVPAVTAIDAGIARTVADSYGLPEVYFFLPNQFWKHKNHECVIQALNLLRVKGQDVVIAVSGKQSDPRDPEHFPKLQRLVELYDLEKNFRLLGLIPYEHIKSLMRACAALINPSTFEGWSTTVEEAKAMGTPMILSSLRVHQEQCQDATFFNAESPEKLADILSNFPLANFERRLSMSDAAIKKSSSGMKLFAEEFANLMELRVADKTK
ncbi:MAG: glycosyltransferase family 1 protein [Betaproteobacteria bacterium]